MGAFNRVSNRTIGGHRNANNVYHDLVQLTVSLLRNTINPDSPVNYRVLDNKPGALMALEQHGLSPLIWDFLRYRNHDKPLSPATMQQLKISAWRSGFAALRREEAAKEFFSQIENQLQVQPIALKGFALANTVYDSPYLRQMADIDLLIPEDSSEEVTRILTNLGYSFEEPPRNRRNIHHHLPIAWRQQKSMRISIECHTNVFSADVPDSLTFEQAHSQKINLNDWSLSVLSWEEQWLNLSRHQFEPALYPALKGYVDMGLLLHQHADTMDWQWIAANSATSYALAHRIANLLNLSMPNRLSQTIIPNAYCVPNTGIPKLAELRSTPFYGFKKLLFPSSWWLAGRYNARSSISRLLQHHFSLISSITLRLRN